MRSESGQVILALILAMTTALAIGLSVIQKSLVDVSTSTKLEESSRAFSAAEAAIEEALKRSSISPVVPPVAVSFPETSSQGKADVSEFIPILPPAGTRQDPFEFFSPPLSKEEVVQVWLAEYTSTDNPPPDFYKQSTIDIYWGNSQTDRAALELTLIYFDDPAYKSWKWYLDHNITRTPPNNFEQVSECNGHTVGANTYQCKRTLNLLTDPEPDIPTSATLMLLRARLLYNSSSQPFAVQAVDNCGRDCSLPHMARIFLATGFAGETQRKVKVEQFFNVIPPYFDYALFSVGEIKK